MFCEYVWLLNISSNWVSSRWTKGKILFFYFSQLSLLLHHFTSFQPDVLKRDVFENLRLLRNISKSEQQKSVVNADVVTLPVKRV